MKFLQRAINRLSPGAALVDDGGFGPKTFSAMQALVGGVTEGGSVLALLKEQRRERYQDIVANDPSQGKFLKGWLRRVNEDVA